MKVLRLIGSMDPLTGGPCQGIRNSIAALTTLGVYNEVVCLDAPNANYLGADPFPIHTLGPSKSPWHYSAKLLPWLLEQLPKFDVLIVHGLWLYPSYAARQAQQKLKQQRIKNQDLKIPCLFIMPHGMLDPWFQEAKTRQLKAIRNWFYWKLIEHKVVRDADGLLFTSETELQMARLPFKPYQPKQEVNVGYGIQEPPAYSQSMKEAFRAHHPDSNKTPYLLFISRIHEKKGVDLLLKAYAGIVEQQPQRNFPNLVIAGPGLDTHFGEKLHQFASETPCLQQRVFFTGMLTGLAKWGAFYGCEAFVLPSHQENFGIAVAEAMACGKPVLISNRVNIWREIESGGGGLVTDNILEGVEKLLLNWFNLDTQNREVMGKQARQIFSTNYAVAPAAIRFKSAFSWQGTTLDKIPID
ncbi:MAG: glycosyltransferase [Cytophagales bacterium]|nr:MAG: glycosyltransferase [Cytophagales bacterium]